MQYSLAVLAGFAAVALAAPQGVTSVITPTAAAPAGCTADNSLFEISVSTLSSKAKRADTLEISLSGGVLTDNQGRRGYIAANNQLQFDSPVQAGAIYTGGFSVCANNTLALGDSAVWYECLSGPGNTASNYFYNIYDDSIASYCKECFLDVVTVSGGLATSTASGVATSATDGQVYATTTIPVTSSAAVVTSISDHQIQGATTTTAVVSSVVVVTSISAVTTAAAVVTSISDYQIQAPTATTPVVSSIAVVGSSTISLALITSISDHQIQAPTATSASVVAYTGAAALPTMAAQLVLAAGAAAAFML